MRHANATEERLEEMLPAERKLLQRMAADKKAAALKRLALETTYVQQVILQKNWMHATKGIRGISQPRMKRY